LHASDVQGPVTKSAKEYIIGQKPDLLIMDGPPTIFLGWKFSMKSLQDAADNLVEIIERLKCDVILDHHLLRDLKYKEVFSQPYQKGGTRVKTFAEYLGMENNTLEAHRKELWGK
jgi:predicted metallo-beta-lactamase superfamily hydrolase